ncbi:uncharacterized protein E0L32_008335 [Thyridium curvatum]|uniref:Cytochrome P450 n=1 Tax=Thyridium curvatum TaxID=1093900 RepID=A0A507AVM5_9PEZI|nr:uncharacterized protein E0L32_008335 [Thyridium curvatum]TPX10766.1 hypothetical protein E0L32_008335 [Thyridium curvatum]
MISSFVLLGVVLVVYAVFQVINGLRTNIAKARQSGVPYIVVRKSRETWGTYTVCRAVADSHMHSHCALQSGMANDMAILEPEWSFRELNEPYRRLGESFIVVSPGRMIMFTQDADVIRQVAARREDFPKLTSTYELLALFGKNVLTTEGQLWRMHRKVTSASFNERNAAHTFAEAIHQSQGMVDKWLRQGGGTTITSIEHDTMTLALNIIGYVGFGLRFLWPGQSLPADMDPRLKKYGSLTPPAGHSMTFAESLATVLERIVVLLLTPKKLLGILPFKAVKEAAEADMNYRQYMKEFLADKIEDVRRGDRGEGGMDIMGQLVRTKYGDKTGKEPDFDDDDIIGNAFIITVAGHETTANVLHFTLLELATNPAAQRQLQADIDRLFGDSDPSTWGYEQNVNAMLASMLGATMNETLRTMPPVVGVPKIVSRAGNPVVTASTGDKLALPADMTVILSAVAVQRNPRFWPSRPSRLTGAPTDLDDYLPERWFRTEDKAGGAAGAAAADAMADEDTEDYGGFKGPDTSAQLFHPYRGSFIPFSEGARSCLGRRIAQVEIIAALAVVFQRHSLELAVDGEGIGVGDGQVAAMGRPERAALYQRAQARCRETLRGATTLLTLKLHGSAYVPVRLVKRGEERFVNFVDA